MNGVSFSSEPKSFFEILDENEDRVIVPTIAVAELLAGVDKGDYARFLGELSARFFCPTFDLPAAAIAAQLWHSHRSLPKSEQYNDRRVPKADVLLVATAKSAGARRLYSHDGGCRKLATAVGLEAHDLPTHHPDLFRDHEIRGGES